MGLKVFVCGHLGTTQDEDAMRMPTRVLASAELMETAGSRELVAEGGELANRLGRPTRVLGEWQRGGAAVEPFFF